MDGVLAQFLGFSAAELRFLEAARDAGSSERAALQLAMRGGAFNSSLLFESDNKAASGEPPPLAEDPSGGPTNIDALQLLLAMLPLPILAAFSLYLRLGLHHKLALGAVRCTVQLSALGFILVPIFVANRWWLTAVYSLFMLMVAAAESVSRPPYVYSGMIAEVLLAMGVACAVTICFGLAAVIQQHPWYDAQYLIPMLGMLLGNSCSSVAVGLSAVLEELSSGKDKVEALLALGATRVEATREVVVRAARLALTPLLNSLNVVGIVSIPGMMTGQILGGSDPATAARYQIVIFFLVAVSSSVSAVAAIYAAVLTVCDTRHRLRSEKLMARTSKTSGALMWLAEQANQGWNATKKGLERVVGKVKRAMEPRPARTRHRVSRYLAGGDGRRAEEGQGSEDGGVEEPLLEEPQEQA